MFRNKHMLLLSVPARNPDERDGKVGRVRKKIEKPGNIGLQKHNIKVNIL